MILGGLISEGYPLLDYIDNNYVTYVGVLDYKTKIDYTKESLAHTLLHKNPINWTLSGLEALAYGCRLITSTAGFWPSFINNNIGRMVTSEEDFLRAFDSIHHIDQRHCWETANKYNSDVMVESCRSAFEQILK